MTPATALSWELWRRHRLGLAAVGALVAAFTAVCAVNPLRPELALANSIFFGIGVCYVVAVFAYGFDGKLESAESGFPARQFRLPVRTAVLAGWPMVQGVLVAVGLWLAWDRLVLRPSGVETPRWAPALLAAGVAVSQALVWLPFGVPWLRAAVMTVGLFVLARASAILALLGDDTARPEVQDRVLTALAAVLLPAAFLVAIIGVARARRGDTPDWFPARPAEHAPAPARESRPFRCGVQAQVWYEWRARGRAFVLSTALMIAVLATVSAATERTTQNMTNFASVFLVVPVLFAASWGPYGGSAGTATGSRGGLSAFAATRPLGNVAYVRAKFHAALVTAAAAWLVVLAALALWLSYTGGHRDLRALWVALVEKQGPLRAAAIGALVAVGPMLLTWRMMVVGLWTGLTGRPWVVFSTMAVGFVVLLQGMYEWTLWNADTARRDRILDALPWVAGGLLALKLAAAAAMLAVLRLRRQLDAPAVTRIVTAWGIAVATLFGLLAWLVPEGVVEPYQLALGAALVVPLARLLAAPLAFTWNRHR